MRLRARENSDDSAGICFESEEKSKPPPMNPMSGLLGVSTRRNNSIHRIRLLLLQR